MTTTEVIIKVVPAGSPARDGSDGYRMDCSCGDTSGVLRRRVAEEIAAAHNWKAHHGKAVVT
jgi:hypothetical protein